MHVFGDVKMRKHVWSCSPLLVLLYSVQERDVAFTYGAIGCQIDPSWWTHYAISRRSQCSTTNVTKAVVCVNLSME